MCMYMSAAGLEQCVRRMNGVLCRWQRYMATVLSHVGDGSRCRYAASVLVDQRYAVYVFVAVVDDDFVGTSLCCRRFVFASLSM